MKMRLVRKAKIQMICRSWKLSVERRYSLDDMWMWEDVKF
jgi:hypothetical protein